jgi:hypothetical protein
MICDEVTHRGARLTTREELLSVIESLAGEIDSGSEAQEFRDRARRQLGSILE